jgi:hypothetical protein
VAERRTLGASIPFYSFETPSDEELDHDFLWRCVKGLPERGRIGIFDRSCYGEVLVVRVHQELLERERLRSWRRPDAPCSAGRSVGAAQTPSRLETVPRT